MNENYTALHIDREKKKNLALKLIDELREEVESTRTTVYCSNKMINIVVDVMHYQYAEKGIKLNADIVLPTILYLDEMKICSIIQTMLNECLSILSLAQMENPKVDFQIKKADGKIMFMARCPVENIRNSGQHISIEF